MKNEVRDVVLVVSATILICVFAVFGIRIVLEDGVVLQASKGNCIHTDADADAVSYIATHNDIEFVLTPRVMNLIFKDKSIKSSVFENKSVLIYGTVLRKDRDIANFSFIELRFDEVTNVGCYFDISPPKGFSNLQPGQEVTIKGTFKGVVFDSIIISESELIECN